MIQKYFLLKFGMEHLSYVGLPKPIFQMCKYDKYLKFCDLEVINAIWFHHFQIIPWLQASLHTKTLWLHTLYSWLLFHLQEPQVLLCKDRKQ
jgi:hypothetical protein